MMQEAIYVDVGVGLFLILSAVLSARAGFVKSVLSIVGWILAAALTVFLLPYAEKIEGLERATTEVDSIISAAILFVVLLAVFLLIAHLVSRQFDYGDVGVINRVLGFLFGLLRGAFILAVAYLVASLLFPPREYPEWIKQAQVTPAVAEGAALITWLAPERVEAFERTLKESRKRAEEAVREERRKKQQQRNQ